MDSWLWGWLETGRKLGVKYSDNLDAALNAHCTLSKSIGWFYPFNDFAILTDRPEIISRDEQNRLHSVTGAALKYRDGYSLHYVHGVRVPDFVIERPQEITLEKINSEHNAEVRRVMIERYKHGHEQEGYSAYLMDSGAKEIDRDEVTLKDDIILYRKDIPDDEPIVMLSMLNSTPEPDGTIKRYMLRVPPDITKALDAMAWTWGLKPEEYRPLVET
jgi:hypothetical protein